MSLAVEETLTHDGKVRTPRRIGAVVAEELVRRLSGDEFEPGDKLPTEPELQLTFGVSRTALREALKWIESRGLISIRQGRGAVVNPIEHWDLTEPIVLGALLENNPGLDMFGQLMAVRTWLEPQLARSAASLVSQESLNTLRKLLDSMSNEIGQQDPFMQHDVEFHEIIKLSAGNLIARSIMTSIATPLWISRRLMNQFPGASRDAHREHLAIYDALAARDPDRAEAAMRDHLIAGLHRGEEATKGIID